jgi:hypothetical protein
LPLRRPLNRYHCHRRKTEWHWPRAHGLDGASLGESDCRNDFGGRWPRVDKQRACEAFEALFCGYFQPDSSLRRDVPVVQCQVERLYFQPTAGRLSAQPVQSNANRIRQFPIRGGISLEDSRCSIFHFEPARSHQPCRGESDSVLQIIYRPPADEACDDAWQFGECFEQTMCAWSQLCAVGRVDNWRERSIKVEQESQVSSGPIARHEILEQG